MHMYASTIKRRAALPVSARRGRVCARAPYVATRAPYVAAGAPSWRSDNRGVENAPAENKPAFALPNVRDAVR